MSRTEKQPVVTEFQRTMDPQSLEIVRDGKFLGHLNWHNGNARVVFHTSEPLISVPLDVMESIVNRGKLELSRVNEKRTSTPGPDMTDQFLKDILL